MSSSLEEQFKAGAERVGLELEKAAIGQLSLYWEELEKWNAKINLIGLRDPSAIIATLFVDSLAVHLAIPRVPIIKMLDIGTGAGFPGLVLKVVLPDVDLTLLEPNKKKVAFLHHVIGTLDLQNVRVESMPIEQFSAFCRDQNKFTVAVTKALSLSVCLRYVPALLAKDGCFIAYRSKPLEKHDNLQGFVVENEIRYELPDDFGSRILAVLKYPHR